MRATKECSCAAASLLHLQRRSCAPARRSSATSSGARLSTASCSLWSSTALTITWSGLPTTTTLLGTRASTVMSLTCTSCTTWPSAVPQSQTRAAVQDTVLAHAQTRFQANTALAEMRRLFASSAQVAGASGPVQSAGSRAVTAAASTPSSTALAKHCSTGGVNPDKICLRCGRCYKRGSLR
jgi:hypothetical protein